MVETTLEDISEELNDSELSSSDVAASVRSQGPYMQSGKIMARTTLRRRVSALLAVVLLAAKAGAQNNETEPGDDATGEDEVVCYYR